MTTWAALPAENVMMACTNFLKDFDARVEANRYVWWPSDRVRIFRRKNQYPNLIKGWGKLPTVMDTLALAKAAETPEGGDMMMVSASDFGCFSEHYDAT